MRHLLLIMTAQAPIVFCGLTRGLLPLSLDHLWSPLSSRERGLGGEVRRPGGKPSPPAPPRRGEGSRSQSQRHAPEPRLVGRILAPPLLAEEGAGG